jgi:flagellin-like hook-associated protein FlgL
MEERKEINKIKDITDKDWEMIAKILVKEDNKKFKKAFDYLNTKYKVNFTYQNFYGWIKNNELKVLKSALLDEYYETLEDSVNTVKKSIDLTLKQLEEINKKCSEAHSNVLKGILFLTESEAELDRIKRDFQKLREKIDNLNQK